jgi:hypothetical protein
MAWNIVSRFSVITGLWNYLPDSGVCLSTNVWQGFQLGTASVHDVSSLHLFSVMEDGSNRPKNVEFKSETFLEIHKQIDNTEIREKP